MRKMLDVIAFWIGAVGLVGILFGVAAIAWAWAWWKLLEAFNLTYNCAHYFHNYRRYRAWLETDPSGLREPSGISKPKKAN